MKQAFFILTCISFVCSNALSQPYEYKESTGYTGTGANIDVKYHRFDWNINPDNTIRISGNVTTYFVTTKNNVSQITFDFAKSSYNNGSLKVYYHGSEVSKSFPTSGNQNILRINLPGSLAIGVLDSLTIFYNGVPPSGGSAPGGCKQPTVNGYPIFFTISESYEDKDWWPCKADMQDKIDSTDYFVTTPKKYRAALLGSMVSETTSGANTTYHSRHRYPTASYLISVAVAEYNVFDRGTVNINGTNTPVVYYITKGRAPSSSDLTKMDYCKDELVAFSNLFGDYPFKNEKYGMYEFGFGGGMEHQTFSGMSYNAMKSWSVVAHELMHQWFGDKVSAATWNHLWLSEGFASYGEVLAAEIIPALGASASAVRLSNKNDAINRKNYGCVIPDSYIVNSGTLWNSNYGSTVYSRGGMVVSMLRTLMGDTKFFQACRNYLNDPQLQYGAATTADLQAHMEAVLGGFDLSGFFDSFAYGNGYPDYGKNAGNSIKWQSIGGGKIRFRVDAPAKSAGSTVSKYYSVIPLKVTGAGGKEKLVVLYDQGSIGISVGGDGITFGNSPTPEVDLGFTPTAVSFDPDNMSLVTGATLKTTVMPVSIASFTVSQNASVNNAVIQLADNQKPSSVTLEKSTDGSHFVYAGIMKYQQQGHYSYQDISSVETIFYRAKIIEVTGEITYSAIIKIAGKPIASFSLVTNPVQNNIKIKVPSTMKNELLQFSVFDISGKKMFESERKALNGIIQLDAGPLINGTYLLHIQSPKKYETLKFIVNK